ncbi:LuxR C-terminal-related transcriptional regulator [Planctomycetota bacterium]
MTKETKTTVLLVDDHAIFRKGLRLLLDDEDDMEVVGEAGDGEAAIARARELSPQVLVMDITMPNMDGIEATKQILTATPETKVVALSIHSGKRFVEDMLQAGAAGYVLKESAPEELVSGIRAVVRGEVYLSGAIAGVVVSQYRQLLSQGNGTSERPALTEREQGVFQMLVAGHAPEEIAQATKTTVKSVTATQRRLMKKLDVQSLPELTEMARRQDHSISSESESSDACRASLALISTKFHRPATVGDLVTRTVLLEQLEEASTKPLTLISAPAGYGKSTLASLWLEKSRWPHAWLSLDPDDNDLRTFLNYFLAALRSMFPESCEACQQLLAAPNLPTPGVLSRTLLNDLDHIDEPFVLVLDDYHRIREMPVNDLLSELLRHPPHPLHLVILTRQDPGLPISSLRAHGQVLEIGTGQLRFSVTETARFLQNSLQGPVKESTAAVLEKKTEGWATGLRLATLSLRDSTDLDRLAKSLQGSSHYIADYLIAEVINKQPEEMARFLLETSILDRFCAPLCEAVHASSETQALESISGTDFIAWLERSNLFVIPLDHENRWFRYHRLFQQLLQNQLGSRLGSEEVALLHSRAGDWLEDRCFVDEALSHVLAAKQPEKVAEIVERHRHRVANEDHAHVVEKWLDRLPPKLIQERPALLLARAWQVFEKFQLQAIPSLIDRAEDLLTGANANPSLAAEIDFHRGYLAVLMEGNGEAAVKGLEGLQERLPETQLQMRGEAAVYLALGRLMMGEGQLALRELDQQIRATASSNGMMLSRLVGAQVFVRLLLGHLTPAARMAERFINVGQEASNTYIVGWAYYLQAIAQLQSHDLDNALQGFLSATEHCDILHRRAAVDSLVGLVLTYQALQRSEDAWDALKKLKTFARETHDSECQDVAASCQARLSLMQGDNKAALSWAQTFDAEPHVPSMLFWLEIPLITQARILIATGTEAGLEKALTILTSLQEQFTAIHNTYQWIQVSLLTTIALEKQGRGAGALVVLEEVIVVTEPQGWVRPFVEMGTTMIQLLRRLAGKGVSQEYLQMLLAAFPHDNKETGSSAASPMAKNEITPVVSSVLLTQREAEILVCVAEGLSNKEIAAKLFLSTETIKKHLYNTYQKLDADSRISAIAKAKELGILSR